MGTEMHRKESRNFGSIARIIVRACVYAVCLALLLAGLAVGLFVVLEWTGHGNWSPLHTAVRWNDVSQLQALLRDGADPDIVEEWKGQTPVLLAAEIGNRQAMKALLDAGADPEIANGRGQKAMHLVVRRDDSEGLNLLVEAGADPNSRDAHGQTPLHLAFESGAADLVQELLDAGADPFARREGGDTPLHVAAAIGKAETIALLIRAETAFRANDRNMWYVLGRLALTRYAKAVEALLWADAALDTPNDRGLSPLQMARSRIAVPDDAGWTALHIGAMAGDHALVRSLLAAGSQPDMGGKDVATPLQMAASRGHVAVVRTLIEGGSALDALDADGRTALIRAVRRGHLEVARLLRDSGAGTRAVTNPWPVPEAEGAYAPPSVALHWAAWLGDRDMLKSLLASGSQPGVQDREGRTPLHIAAGEGHLESVQILLDAGADARAKDKAGWMPLTMAALHGHADVAKAIESETRPDQVRSFSFSLHMKWVQEMTRQLRHDEVAEMDSWQQHDWAISWMDGNKATTPNDAVRRIWEDQDMERALLEDGAPENEVGDDGATRVHLAVLANDADRVRSLLAAGADPDTQSNHWGTPLSLAIRRSGLAVIKALLDEGADPNGRDPEGQPLLWATSTVAELETLLAAGADPDIRYCFDTALHKAARDDEAVTALVLLRAGADPMARARHPFGWTPLKVAAQWSSLGTTRLIKLGISQFSNQ